MSRDASSQITTLKALYLFGISQKSLGRVVEVFPALEALRIDPDEDEEEILQNRRQVENEQRKLHNAGLTVFYIMYSKEAKVQRGKWLNYIRSQHLEHFSHLFEKSE